MSLCCFILIGLPCLSVFSDILRRLQELSQKPAEKHNSTEKVLKELKEQEDRHRKMLDELRQQVAEARQPVNVMYVMFVLVC